jgi:VanZ family protein
MKKTFLLVLVIVWMGVIFYLSSQNGHKSHQASKAVVYTIQGYAPEIASVQHFDIQIINGYFRKSAHFFEYAALALLVYLLLVNFRFRYRGLVSFLVCVLFAITDEVHQAYTPDRTSSGFDVIIDSLGALAALVMLFVLKRIIRGTTNEG